MNRIPHFFKASTRLGLTNPPVGKSEPNVGVEDAPDAILTREFLAEFPKKRVSEYEFSLPEVVDKKNIWDVTARESIECVNLINSKLDKDETQVVVGGDNSVTFCSLIAILQRLGDSSAVAHIHIDTHGDINSVDASPSGNWHGMYLRPIFRTDFEIPQITMVVPSTIPIHNLLFIGNCEFDGDEPELVKRNKMRVIDTLMLRSGNAEATTIVNNLLHRVKHVHMSIDIDAFDESVAPATGLPKKNGLLYDDIKPVFSLVREFPSISFDLVEINPKLEGAEKTIEFAQRMMRYLLS